MASHKIAKKNGTADELELSVAQALFDLENNVNDLKTELKPLQISSAKEVSLGSDFLKVGNQQIQDTGQESIARQGLSATITQSRTLEIFFFFFFFGEEWPTHRLIGC